VVGHFLHLELHTNPEGHAHIDAGLRARKEAEGALRLEHERSVGEDRPE
jgi:hypothetical protein